MHEISLERTTLRKQVGEGGRWGTEQGGKFFLCANVHFLNFKTCKCILNSI